MKNSRFVIEGYRRLWWLWTFGGWRVAHSVMCTTTAGGSFVRKPDIFLSISRHAYQEGFAIAGPPHSLKPSLQSSVSRTQHLLLIRSVWVHVLCK